MPTSAMGSRGRTVIPKAIREHLGLHPGDVIDFVVAADGGVLVRPAVEDVRRLKRILKRPRRGAVSVQEMNRAIQSHGLLSYPIRRAGAHNRGRQSLDEYRRGTPKWPDSRD